MSELRVEYGRALYELSEESGAQDVYLSQIREIDRLFAEHPEYLRLLGAPNVPAGERASMLDESFGGRCEEYILSFMKLMVERGYAPYLRECFAEYEDIYLDRHGIIRARVETAAELSDEQQQALRKKLEAYSKKKVEMSVSVNPSLIGGVRVMLDGKLLEGSVKARLDKLRSDITKITI